MCHLYNAHSPRAIKYCCSVAFPVSWHLPHFLFRSFSYNIVMRRNTKMHLSRVSHSLFLDKFFELFFIWNTLICTYKSRVCYYWTHAKGSRVQFQSWHACILNCILPNSTITQVTRTRVSCSTHSALGSTGSVVSPVSSLFIRLTSIPVWQTSDWTGHPDVIHIHKS